MTRFEDFVFAPGVMERPFYALADGIILFRPWSPLGKTAGGLWLERNPNHPKIWGWITGVSRKTMEEHPTLVPGAMVVVTRHNGEPIDRRDASDGSVIHTIAMPVTAISLAINPPLVPLRGFHAYAP